LACESRTARLVRLLRSKVTLKRISLLPLSILLSVAFGSTLAAGGVAAGRPFTMALTYAQTNQGKNIGQISKGIEGKGTISMRTGGLPGGVPATAFTKGGTYVVRYEIDAAGTYHGTMVVTAPLGSVCLVGVVKFGKYDPTAGTGFPPTSGTFTSAGGTGLGSRLVVTGRYKATKVTGAENTLLKVSFIGTSTVSPSSPRAPTKACLSVAKLAHA
jgi:hypothetical protein